jgi:hypothetical protein
MWHVMVFDNVNKHHPVKVISLETIKQLAYILDMPAQAISNFYHGLIRARGALQYVAIFKD